MASAETLRNQFLEDSARFLAVSSPSTAAHLGSEARDLRYEAQRDLSPLANRHACGACGSFYIPGYNSSVGLDKTLNRRAPFTKTVKVQCNACGRSSLETILVPKKKNLRNDGEGKDGVASGMRRESIQRLKSPTPTVQSVSSGKKRARGRRPDNLQALVAKARQTKQKVSYERDGLSLKDFMRE